MKNMRKIRILLSALLLSWGVCLADHATSAMTPKRTGLDSLTIELFAVDSLLPHRSTEIYTLWLGSSNEERIVDSLNAFLKFPGSGKDTVYIRSVADSAFIASFAVKVIPISQNLNGGAEQVDTSDKRAWIKDYSLIFIAIILLTLLIVSYIKSSRRKRKLNDLYEEQRDLKEREKELERLVQDKDNDRDYRRLFNENQDLKRKIIQQREFRSSEVVSAFREDMEQATLNSNKLYAVSINDGYFYHITEEPTDDTIFEITKNGERNASFAIYSAVYERVMARPGFLDGCDVQKLSSNPYTLDVEQGSTREEDGRWKVITKAKVKFV